MNKLFYDVIVYIYSIFILGEWRKAYELCQKYTEGDEGVKLLINKGKTLEQMGKVAEAEKLYLIIQQPDLAISMYKNNRQYDQVKKIRTLLV